MGPYYLTALVSLLGPVRRVTGSARVTFPERKIRSQPRAGERIAVETPTHLAAVLDFVSGAIATLVTSFDVWVPVNADSSAEPTETFSVPRSVDLSANAPPSDSHQAGTANGNQPRDWNASLMPK